MASEPFLEKKGRAKSVKLRTAFNHHSIKRDAIVVFETPKLTGKVMRYTLLYQEYFRRRA